MPSAKVKVVEIDKSRTIQNTSGAFFTGIVIPAKKGPSFQPVLVNRDRSFIDQFGAPDPRYSLSHYSALSYLEEAGNLMVVRVHNGGKIGGIAVNKNGGTGTTEGFDPGYTEDETGITFPAFDTDILMHVYAVGAGVYYNGLTIVVDPTAGESDEFSIVVKSGTTVLETWLVSRKYKLDTRGQQMYMVDRINGKSKYIKVRDNVAELDTVMPEAVVGTALAGGVDGTAVTDADLIKGLPFLFADRENFPVKIVMDGGFATVSYAQALAQAAKEARAQAILTVPISDEESSTAVADIVTYRQSLNLGNYADSAALYTTAVEFLDRYNGNTTISIPCDGVVAAVHAKTRAIRPWLAPAGTNRGGVQVIRPIRVFHENSMDSGDLDVLADADVNSFKVIGNRGIFVWGQKNLLGTLSALSRIDVRNLVNEVADNVSQFLIDFGFEKVVPATLSAVRSAINSYMETVKGGDGVSDYTVIADETNNTDQTISNYEMHVDLYMTPTKSAERIVFGIIITRDDVTVEEARISTGVL